MNRPFLKSQVKFETFFCNYFEWLPENSDTKVYVGILKNEFPSIDDMVYLKNDFEIGRSIASAGILKSLEMVRTDDGFMIYKEYFNGIPLEKYLLSKEFSIPLFLQLAIRLTKLLKTLHNNKLIIKEFTLENILVSPETLEMRICSLGSASRLNRERLEFGSEFVYYGPLWHIAPEQTGRIGRTVDYRADYYSLGVMFYQILCWRKPFNFTDSLELIHAHIAKKPIEPKHIQAGIPPVINDIVMKLMSKNAEDRYQSEEGIILDLENCTKEWQLNGRIDDFSLASKDQSSSFILSEKMYGRNQELALLVKAWEGVRKNPMEWFLVAGYSGIGKTRLINEIRKPVLESNGYFISGKFDQFNRESPYSAFGSAFNMLIQQMLSGKDEDINRWKNAIKSFLGDNCAVLTGIITEFEKLTGPQEALLELGPLEGKKRFFEAFISFLSILEEEGQPIVIFIDDLQWADSGSLDLISSMMHHSLKNILLIGAYRDNEVDESHPLMMTLKFLEKESAHRITRLQLHELTFEDINHLISDSLHLNSKTTEELTELIMTKTRGNPFFVKQFIEKLVEEKRIYFDVDLGSWIWDLKSIAALELTDYVVDLILLKLKKLSDVAQEIISLAACIGNTFDLDTLSIISERTKNELAELLWESVNADFINPIGQWIKYHHDTLWEEFSLAEKPDSNFRFRFQHDRIQQAAYAMIPETEKKSTHLWIGRMLLAKLKDDEFEENFFDVLNHINTGRDLITSARERKELAEFNLKAATKAAKNNALRPSLYHYTIGMDMISGDQNTELFKDLLIGRSEVEYLIGNYQASEELFNKALQNANSNLNKADILCKKMALYENTQRHELALEAAQQGLKLLGMHLPLNANTFHVMKELLTVKFLLRNKSTDDLLKSRDMEAPEKKLMMKILMNLWGPVYLLQKENLLAFKILRMVNLSVRYGNSIESALAYAFYGYVLSAQLKDYKGGYNFAKLGIALNEKFQDKSLRSKVLVIAVGCVEHWQMSFKNTIHNLREGYNVGLESNDIIYAGYALSFLNRSQFLMGEDLDTVYEKLIGYLQFSGRIQSIVSTHQMLAWARLITDLGDFRAEEKVFGPYVKDLDQEKYYEQLISEQNLPLPMANYCIAKSMYHYFMSDFSMSASWAERAQPLLKSVPGLPEWGEHTVFSCLASLACVLDSRHLSKSQKDQGRKNLKVLENWAKASPENYESRYLLAMAELSSIEGQVEQAKEYYSKALKSSQDADVRYMSAIIYERTAAMHLRLKETEPFEKLMHLALIEYQNWKAVGKVRSLLRNYPFLDIHSKEKSSVISSSMIDLESILKASSSLSGEVVLENLLEKLLLIVIENAGAQNGFLFRHRNNQIYLDASSRMINANVCEIKSYLIDEVDFVSRAIVRKVNNTKEIIILDDVRQDPLYSNDAQLKLLGTRSLLCMPILSKGEMTAILYLDNKDSSHAFTRGRLELLNLLSGQMAVSIENAQLYQNLELKVLERTSTIEKQKLELEEEKRKTDALLLNILPDEIAQELKSHGSSKPRRHESVTIMFSDFEKFTMMSEALSPEEIVEFVDYFYKAFDRIIDKYNIEKIKTIGDAYMCVSGLPNYNPEHAINAVKAAVEIVQFVEQYNAEHLKTGQPFCRIRVGLHTGPVVAGVVGLNKFAYDIWGDSVNTASRLQTVCEPGKVNLSKTTFELIKDHFNCEHRGKIKMKYKDELDMYYVQI